MSTIIEVYINQLSKLKPGDILSRKDIQTLQNLMDDSTKLSKIVGEYYQENINLQLSMKDMAKQLLEYIEQDESK